MKQAGCSLLHIILTFAIPSYQSKHLTRIPVNSLFIVPLYIAGIGILGKKSFSSHYRRILHIDLFYYPASKAGWDLYVGFCNFSDLVGPPSFETRCEEIWHKIHRVEMAASVLGIAAMYAVSSSKRCFSVLCVNELCYTDYCRLSKSCILSSYTAALH